MRNAYVVRTKEPRSYTEVILDDGTGPEVPVQPISPVVADSPAQAKRLFLKEFAEESCSGVFSDDWTSLRVRLLFKGVDLPTGVYQDDDWMWGRIHEIEDHGGAACTCPEYDPE